MRYNNCLQMFSFKLENAKANIELSTLIRIFEQGLVYQALSNELHRQSYFSSDQGGKTGVMPKHNEDFSNAEHKGKNKFMGGRI